MTFIPLGFTPNHYVRGDDLRQVRIVQVEPPGPSLVVEWEPPDMSRQAGGPRWDVYQRVGLADGQEYLGQELRERRIEVLLDGWGCGPLDATGVPTHRSIEREAALLDGWQVPPGGVGSGQIPPRLRVEYGPWQDMLWRVERIRWGAPLMHAGNRVRQDAIVELKQWTTSILGLSPVEAAAASATEDTGTATPADPHYVRPGARRTYTVKDGDSLYTIARDVLLDASRWGEIAELNSIRDPYVVVPGQVLQLP